MRIKLQDIISWGLVAVALFLPWQTKYTLDASIFGRQVWQFDSASLFGLDILLFFIFVVGFKKFQGIEKPNRRRYWFYWPAWLLLLSSAMGVYTAGDKVILLCFVIRLFLAMSLFWLTLNFRFDLKKFYHFFLIGAASSAALGIAQFIFKYAPANKWLGLSVHHPAVAGTSVIEIVNNNFEATRWLRAYGSLDHPNILGGYLAIAIIIGLSTFGLDKGKRERLINFLYYAFFVTATAGLFFTFSRSAILALAVGLVPVVIFKYKSEHFIKGLITIFATAACLVFPYGFLYSPRVHIDTRLEAISIEERAKFNKEAVKVIKLNPYIGQGLGNYASAVKNKIDSNRKPYDYQPAHNTFLMAWAEGGIIAALSWLAIIIFAFTFTLKDKITGQRKALNLGLLCAITIISLFDHWFWTLHFGVMLYWLLLGIIAQNLGDSGQKD